MERASLSAPRALLVARDVTLIETLQALCAAAGVGAEVLVDLNAARLPWTRASAVIVGNDLAAEVATLGLPRRDRVLLASLRPQSDSLWRLGVALGAVDVVALDTDTRLSGWLGELSGEATDALTISVIGGSGGAGATTIAVGLAMTAAKQGRSALLIDTDAAAGGIDLVVGCEHLPGVRWPEVATTKGHVSGAALRAALPSSGGLAVLSWDRAGSISASADLMRSMVRAAQGGSEVVVIDLLRHLDDATTQAVTLTDRLIVVAATDVRAVASARALVSRLQGLCADIRVIVRKHRGSDLPPSSVAEALALSPLGTVATSRRVARAVNDGLGPIGDRGLARSCRAILQKVCEEPRDGA